MDSTLIDLLTGLTIVGIPIIIFLPAAIQLLKQIGMPTSWTGAAAAVLGILTAFAVQAVKTWPDISPWIGVVVMGIIMGLAANGLYSQAQHFIQTRTNDSTKEA